MSCRRLGQRVADFSRRMAALSFLTSQRGYVAGIAMALSGAGLLARARRQARPRSPQSLIARPVPHLPSRPQLRPSTTMSESERCVGCQTTVRAKPGAWYSLNGRSYCEDCAPKAARTAGVDLVGVKPMPSAGQSYVVDNGRSSDQPILASSNETAPPHLPPERRIETRLEPTRVKLTVGQSPDGQAAQFVVENGYVLLQRNGWDTGLAVTPALKLGSLRNGTQAVEEDTSLWWLTHIASGRTLGSQPYERIEEAQLIGSVLAQLDWTRTEQEIPLRDISRAQATIEQFNRALAVEKQQRSIGPKPDRVEAKLESPQKSERAISGENPQIAAERNREQSTLLTGQLMADNYGGVARVVEDNGESLFMVDSLGHRYEVGRHEVRQPTDSDFELGRIARSIDPAKTAGLRCAGCERTGSTGEAWYKIGLDKRFCDSCATTYGAEEGYIKDTEITLA